LRQIEMVCDFTVLREMYRREGADKSVNRTLEAKARALAGWKG
jgi:hypothetical protein